VRRPHAVMQYLLHYGKAELACGGVWTVKSAFSTEAQIWRTISDGAGGIFTHSLWTVVWSELQLCRHVWCGPADSASGGVRAWGLRLG
jgi:hypothetical protein